MRRLIRNKGPEFFEARADEWGTDWGKRHAEGKAFYWHHIEGQLVSHHIMPLLKALTQNHCSFCDAFPVSPPGVDTIEHFRPKAEYPSDAFRWSNLYFCCPHCQQKEGAFDETILSPDAEDYEFDNYFRWDHTLGTLEINETAKIGDRARAERTRNYFRLNVDHPTWRKIWLIRRAKLRDDPLDEFPYRDFIDNPPKAPTGENQPA